MKNTKNQIKPNLVDKMVGPFIQKTVIRIGAGEGQTLILSKCLKLSLKLKGERVDVWCVEVLAHSLTVADPSVVVHFTASFLWTCEYTNPHYPNGPFPCLSSCGLLHLFLSPSCLHDFVPVKSWSGFGCCYHMGKIIFWEDSSGTGSLFPSHLHEVLSSWEWCFCVHLHFSLKCSPKTYGLKP